MRTPFPSDWSVQHGLDNYLAENGFTAAGYTDPTTSVSFFGIPFTIPNTPKHSWAIRLHDLHHVATGFGTDMVGEAEISAWEMRHGLRALGLYVGTIVLSLALFGLLIAPMRTGRAWKSASGRGSLFQSKRTYEELLKMNVGELRALLELPDEGVAKLPRRLHPAAPSHA